MLPLRTAARTLFASGQDPKETLLAGYRLPSVFRGPTLHSVIVWLAVVLWLVIVAWSLALMRAASISDRERQALARSAEPPPADPPPGDRPQPRAHAGDRVEALMLVAIVAGDGAALDGGAVGAASTSSACSPCSWSAATS